MIAAEAAGWHGKLPTLGDFATRRLPPAFVQRWDDWLSAGLATLQQQAGWLDGYLASPSWRFLLMPGVMDAQPWAGVLMPSVDRVGRYYPLTIAKPLPALPGEGDEMEALWAWLLRIDEAAADALHEDWTIDTLEAELQRIGLPGVGGRPAALLGSWAAAADGVQRLSLAGHRHGAARMAAEWMAAGALQAGAAAYWYSEADLAAPQLLRSDGLAATGLPRLLFGGLPAHADGALDGSAAGLADNSPANADGSR